MSKIQIIEIGAEHDCETCGPTWATGYEVTIDGVPFGDFTPHAHCFHSIEFSMDQVMTQLLEHLGHELTFGPVAG